MNYAMLPLYVPHDFLCIGFGGRIGELICGKDTQWNYADGDIAQVSFQNVTEAIDRFILPWFEQYADEEKLRKKLLEDKKRIEITGIGTGYANQEWILALERCEYRDNSISTNFARLKRKSYCNHGMKISQRT